MIVVWSVSITPVQLCTGSPIPWVVLMIVVWSVSITPVQLCTGSPIPWVVLMIVGWSVSITPVQLCTGSPIPSGGSHDCGVVSQYYTCTALYRESYSIGWFS